MKTYEIWIDVDHSEAAMFDAVATPAAREQLTIDTERRPMVLLKVFEAETWEEANRVYRETLDAEQQDRLASGS